jgi:3-ketosteroid 9alpha-monooxygenase subunit A
MGTHLAKNESSYVVTEGTHIVGDSITCPYHAWRFGPDGRCNHIPYFNGPIPAAAKIRSWPVLERYGIIWMWHDPEAQEPDEFPMRLPAWDDPSWVHWKIDHMGVMPLHPVEALDNMADWFHLNPIHGEDVRYFENEFIDKTCIQRQGGVHKTLAAENLLETYTWYEGPGFLQSKMTGQHDTHMIICHTPIEDGVIKVWHALLVQGAHPAATAEDVAVARAYQEASRAAFSQDADVWMNKRACIQVLQLPTDGPFGKVRTWYRQFYNPRAKAKDIQAQVNGVHRVRGLAAAPTRAAE